MAGGGLSRLAIARLKSAGVLVEPLLKRAGLRPEVIADPEERLSVRSQVALLDEAARPHFRAINCNRANRLIIPEHGHGDQRADAGEFDAIDRQWIALEVSSTLCKVRSLDRLPGLSGAKRRGFWVEMDQRSLPPPLRIGRWQGTVEAPARNWSPSRSHKMA